MGSVSRRFLPNVPRFLPTCRNSPKRGVAFSRETRRRIFTGNAVSHFHGKRGVAFSRETRCRIFTGNAVSHFHGKRGVAFSWETRCHIFTGNAVSHFHGKRGVAFSRETRRLAFSRETRCRIFTGNAVSHFHGKRGVAVLELRRFTRRRTFRDSVKVRRTLRDKRGTRYATLISAAMAHLLHSF